MTKPSSLLYKDNKDKLDILVITGNDDIFREIKNMLSETKGLYSLSLVDNYTQAKNLLLESDYDVFLIGEIGEREEHDSLYKLIKEDIRKPFIAIAEEKDTDCDIALRAGATDCLIKGQFNAAILERSIKQSTETYRMIESLYEKEQKYRSLFERSIDAIFFINKTRHFVDVNPSMLNLFGYSREEMLQMELKDIFDTVEQKKMYSSIMEQEGLVKNFETVLRKRNGEKIFCLINATCQTDLNNKTIGYQGVIHDITELKKNEQEMRKNEMLTLTGRMSRSIAHEVRNPLTNISLSLEQLRDEFPDKEIGFYTDIISRSCKRINNLINQLMQTTRLSDLDMVEYPLNKLLDESLQLVSDRMQLQQVRVVKNYKAGQINLHVDPQKIQTAVLNLLVNAFDAIPEEKGIVIISTELSDDKCVIAVEDNGPGIEENLLENLFDPFYTAKKGGMGLGLTSAQNIIDSHNGNIAVESQVGKGTKFIITFDMNIRNTEEAPAQ